MPSDSGSGARAAPSKESPVAANNRGEVWIPVGDVVLEGHMATPEGDIDRRPPGVIFLHGFPSGKVWAERIGGDLPELVNRVADQMGWAGLSIRFRGCGSSTGNFSLKGWVDDVTASIDFLESEIDPDGIWLVGFGTGGSVGLVAAGEDERVRGVAAAGAPADFTDWAKSPKRLMLHARRVGAIKDGSFPDDFDSWATELGAITAVEAAASLGSRSLLVLHGTDDEIVPYFDALDLTNAYGGNVSPRRIKGGGHLLRHDPRAVAVLLGWLGRQRAEVKALKIDDEEEDGHV